MQFDVDEMCQEKYRLVNEDGTPRDLEKPQVQELLENYKEYIKYKKEHFVGYQTNMGFDYEKDLSCFLNCCVNNLGDPFTGGNFKVNSKFMEREVIRYFATLWRAGDVSTGRSGNEAWGYILSMGSTEGNQYAMLNARDYQRGYVLYIKNSHILRDSEQLMNQEATENKTNLCDEDGNTNNSNNGCPSSVMRNRLAAANQHHVQGVVQIGDQNNHEKYQEVIEQLTNDSISTGSAPNSMIAAAVSEALEKFSDMAEMDTNSIELPSPNSDSNNKKNYNEKLQPQRDLLKQDKQSKDSIQSIIKAVRQGNAHTPVLLYSEQTHYSIQKIRHIIDLPTFHNIGEALYPHQCPKALWPPSYHLYVSEYGDDAVAPHWPEYIPSCGDGTVKIDALLAAADFFTLRGYPIIVCLNYGSSFHGAYDNVGEIFKQLRVILERNNMLYRDLRVVYPDKDGIEQEYVTRRLGYWIHVDGALGAAFGAFFDHNNEKRIQKTSELSNIPVEELPILPSFDFGQEDNQDECERVQSICMSGHKEIGAPFPCGLFVTKRKYMLDFKTINYINAIDSTIAGSRSGFAAIVLWYYLATYTMKDQIQKALKQIELANKIAKKLFDLFGSDKEHEIEIEENGEKKKIKKFISAKVLHHTKNSLSVIFEQPSMKVVDKYSQSLDMLLVGEGLEEGDIPKHDNDNDNDSNKQPMLLDMKSDDHESGGIKYNSDTSKTCIPKNHYEHITNMYKAMNDAQISDIHNNSSSTTNSNNDNTTNSQTISPADNKSPKRHKSNDTAKNTRRFLITSVPIPCAHIFCMEHITEELIDELLQDLLVYGYSS